MEFWNHPLFGNPLSAYATALAILAVVVGLAKLVKHLLALHLLRMAAVSRTRLDDLIVRRVLSLRGCTWC